MYMRKSLYKLRRKKTSTADTNTSYLYIGIFHSVKKRLNIELKKGKPRQLCCRPIVSVRIDFEGEPPRGGGVSNAGGGMELDLDMLLKLNVDQFYGIEIEEFPAQVAQTALWLMDHQMNMLVSENFGAYYVRIPLFVSPSIRWDNALTLDWESVVPKDGLSYIMGNPPFLGSRVMDRRQ
jgi:hypothetical protein